MSSLFSKSAIRQAISSFQGLNIDKEIAIVQELYEDFRKGNMKDETRYEQNFNELFFHQLLGYDPKINLHPKASTPVGSKIADVGLGFFEDGLYSYEGVKVVVELKGCDTLLDKKQASYGGQSPVDQGFGYKTSFKDCPWLIVSNFASVRLYRDNKQDFEIWTIEELANPDNEYYNLKTLLGLLKRNHLISQSGTSFSEKLLSEVRINQEVITKRFYQDYKNLRLELINDIRHNNPEIHVETVVEKAQKIIDRIIFIHFCEDKGLLPEGKLKTNVIRAREADFSPWDVLKKYFKGVDSGSDKLEIPHGYNGGLFHTDPVLNDLEIGDAICHKFIDLGNYSFDDELSVNILGHIFEQSISDIEQLKGELISDLSSGASGAESKDLLSTTIKDPSTRSGGQKEENKKESKRKKDGIFYTPEYIVDYIVQNSLMVYLEEKENECLAKYKKENEAYQAYQHILQNIKVLDPACGSGAFLVKVFDYLYAENKRVGQIVKSLFDDDEIYKSILRNNIYGVDLNPESVEITKLSLWLKSAQKGKKLNNLDENIKCGNSLIDDPAVAGDRAFDWQKEFSDILGPSSSGAKSKDLPAGYGFDVIVGNPPYGAKDKSLLEDSYLLFYYKSIDLLSINGYLGFITPDTRTINLSGKKLRQKILNELKIISIYDVYKVFKDAPDVWCHCLILRNQLPQKNHYYNISREFPYNLDFFQFSRLQNSLDNEQERDIYINQEIKNIFNKIHKIKAVKTNWNRGISPTPNDKNIIKEISEYPIVGGEDIGRYKTNRKTKYLIPTYSKSKETITKIGSQEKIIIQRIRTNSTKFNSRWIIANLIDQKYIPIDSVGYLLENNLNVNLKYYLSILNSYLINFFYKLNYNDKNVKPIFLNRIPIPEISLSEQQPFIDKADLMLSLNKELHEKTDSFLRYISSKFGLEKLSTKLSKFYDYDFATFLKELKFKKLSMSEEAELMDFFENKKSEIVSLKNRIDMTDRAIDEMVFELYGLSEDERAVVLDS